MTGFFGKLFFDPSVCYSCLTMVRRPLSPTGIKFLLTLVLRTTGLPWPPSKNCFCGCWSPHISFCARKDLFLQIGRTAVLFSFKSLFCYIQESWPFFIISALLLCPFFIYLFLLYSVDSKQLCKFFDILHVVGGEGLDTDGTF